MWQGLPLLVILLLAHCSSARVLSSPLQNMMPLLLLLPPLLQVEPLVKSYLGNSLHLLASMTQPEMTAYTLRRLRPSAAFFGPYPRLTKKLLKLGLEIFGSGEKENAPRLQVGMFPAKMPASMWGSATLHSQVWDGWVRVGEGLSTAGRRTGQVSICCCTALCIAITWYAASGMCCTSCVMHAEPSLCCTVLEEC